MVLGKKAQFKFLVILGFAVFLTGIFFMAFFAKASPSDFQLPNMPAGNMSGTIIHIGGTYLNVTWQHVNTYNLTQQEFILDVAQLPNSSTASTTYTISPDLLLADTNFNVSELNASDLNITAYQYAATSSYYYNYTQTITCASTTLSNGTITWNNPSCTSAGQVITTAQQTIPFSEGSLCTQQGATCSGSFAKTSYSPAMIGSGPEPVSSSMFKQPVQAQHTNGQLTEMANITLNQMQVPAYSDTLNAHKYFVIKISNIPVNRTNGIHTTGTFIINLGGNLVWDKTHSSWWNDSWNYFKKITFSGAESDWIQENFTASDFNNNALSNFYDVRLIGSDNTTIYNSTIEESSSGNWVLMRMQPNGATSGYLYYGNSGASKKSDKYPSAWVGGSSSGGITLVYSDGSMVNFTTTGTAIQGISTNGTQLWYSNSVSSGLIYRIDPYTGATLVTSSGAQTDPIGLALNSTSGNVWVGQYSSSGSTDVYKVSQDGSTVGYSGFSESPMQVVLGGGYVWFGQLYDKTMQLVNPNTGAISKTISGLCYLYQGVYYGGAAWYSCTGNIGYFLKINASSFAVTDVSFASSSANSRSVTYCDGYIWAANQGSNTVTRVAPGNLSVNTITGITDPWSISCDGQSVWTTNEGGDEAYKINTSTLGVTTYNGVVSPSQIIAGYIPTEPSFTLGPQQSQISTSVVFYNQTPSNINVTNLWTGGLNISYNITSPNGINASTVKLYYKTNSSTSNVQYYTNGTSYSGYFTLSGTNVSSLWNFSLSDDQVFPGTFNLNQTVMQNSAHSYTSLVKDGAVRVNFLNVSNATSYNIFQFMANSSTGALPLSLFYCNSTYVSGSLDKGDSNCVQFATINPTQTFNITEPQLNNSRYLYAGLYINTTSGKAENAVKVTPKSSVVMLNPDGQTWYVYHVATISRANATQYSVKNGATWTSESYTADAHLQQFDGNKFYYYACANDTLGNYACSSTNRSDIISLNDIPPTVPVIVIPANDTYYGNLNITYNASTSFIGHITKYNITLLNADQSYNKTIIGNNSPNTSYLWDTSTVPDGYYFIKVEATDNYSLSSFAISQEFTVSNNPPKVYLISPANDSQKNGFVVNFTANESAFSNLSNATLYIWNSTGNEIVPFSSSWSYQQNAQSSTVTSTIGPSNSPSLNYTGNYTFSGGSWWSEPNMHDGNWSSYSYGLTSGTYSYMNATFAKPSYANSSSLLRIKDGSVDIDGGILISTNLVNVSIPSTCWNYYSDKIIIRIQNGGGLYNTNNYMFWDCYNGTWVNMRTLTSPSNSTYINQSVMFEMAMWWDGTPQLFYSTNVTGTSNQTNYTYTFPSSGTYYWNVKSCTAVGHCGFNATNYTVVVKGITEISAPLSIILNNAAGRVGSFFRRLSQSVSISNLVSKLRSVFTRISQSLNISASIKRLLSAFRYPSQKVNINASITRSYSAKRTSPQNLLVNSSVLRTFSAFRYLSQTITIRASITRISSFFKLISQKISLSALITRLFSANRNLSQAINVNTTITRQASFFVSSPEQVLISALSLKLRKAFASSSQLLSLSATILVQTGTYRLISQSITINALVTRILNFFRPSSQGITATASVTTYQNFFRKIAQNLNIYNVVSKERVFAHNIYQAISVFTSSVFEKYKVIIKTVTKTIGGGGAIIYKVPLLAWITIGVLLFLLLFVLAITVGPKILEGIRRKRNY